MEKLDFYLEGLTESSYNTKFIKTKREIHTKFSSKIISCAQTLPFRQIE